MSRVYGLKRATPRMKYVHMNMISNWREHLADLTDHPPDRHVALRIIHEKMGADFETWYDKIYSLRRDGRHAEYEKAIFKKLRALLRKETRGDGTMISDGFGTSTSIRCPQCHKKTMTVVRPGDIRCSECDQ